MTTLVLMLTLVTRLLTGGAPGTAMPDSPSLLDRSTDSSSVKPDDQEPPSWNLMPTRSARGQVWANLGYGRITEQYGQNNHLEAAGNAAPLPTSLVALASGLGVTLPLPPGVDGTVQGASARITGDISVVNLHVGGSYAVVSRPAFTFALGADLGFSQQRFEADRITFDVENATVSIPAMGVENAPLQAVAAQMNLQIPQSVPMQRTVQSGFRAQSLMLFAELRRTTVSARFGYQIDVGPAPNLDKNQGENTDRQNAFLLSVSGRQPLGDMFFFGGVDTYLTLAAREHARSFDAGNLYAVSAGVGYDLGFGEVGAAFTFRYRTDGEYVSAFGGQVASAPAPSGYHLGIAPYVSISPKGAAFSFYAKGGVQDEYRDYTLSLSGQNDLAPHLGMTFGLVYGL